MSEIDKFLNGEDDTKKNTSGSQIDSFLKDAPARDKGIGGHLKDTGISLAQGIIGVPEALVGLADIPTGGRVGKFLENEDGMLGFRPKQAREFLGEFKTEKSKQQQQDFQEADGVLAKTGVALSNPSMIANTVVESAPSIGLGGVLGRGVIAGAGAANAARAGAALSAADKAEKARKLGAVGGAVGEGLAMAGSQASEIRSETDDGLLTGTQAAYSAATGVLGALFGWGGSRLAQRLGIGDIDTLVTQGVKRADIDRAIAQEIASAPAKSLPRNVIEGAITEGFLEELPQSVSEQILQNLALDRDWSEGIEDAAVMGTLAGMAMGAGAGGYSNLTRPQGGQGAQQGSPAVDTPPPPASATNPFDQDVPDTSINVGQLEQQGVTPPPVFNPEDIERNLGPTPSQQMGLDPNLGPNSAAAALAVDSGVSQQAAAQQAQQDQVAQTPPNAVRGVDPETGEILNAEAAPEDAQAIQGRLDFIKSQARANGWDKNLVQERDRLTKQLEDLAGPAEPAPVAGQESAAPSVMPPVEVAKDAPASKEKNRDERIQKFQQDGYEVMTELFESYDSAVSRAASLNSSRDGNIYHVRTVGYGVLEDGGNVAILRKPATGDYTPGAEVKQLAVGQRWQTPSGQVITVEAVESRAKAGMTAEESRRRQRATFNIKGNRETYLLSAMDNYLLLGSDTKQTAGAGDAVAQEAQAAAEQPAADIKAITSKQIPQMTDAEIEQAIEHYGPDHKRTKKLQQALEKRRAAQPQPEATSATTTQDIGEQGQPQAGTQADPQGAQQQADVAGAAPAETAPAVDPSARWDGMSEAERTAALLQTGRWTTKGGALNVIGKKRAKAGLDKMPADERATVEQVLLATVGDKPKPAKAKSKPAPSAATEELTTVTKQDGTPFASKITAPENADNERDLSKGEGKKPEAATDPRIAQLNRLKEEMNALADRADKAGDLELATRLRQMYGTVKPVETDVVFRDLNKYRVDTILGTQLPKVTTAERNAEARRTKANQKPEPAKEKTATAAAGDSGKARDAKPKEDISESLIAEVGKLAGMEKSAVASYMKKHGVEALEAVRDSGLSQSQMFSLLGDGLRPHPEFLRLYKSGKRIGIYYRAEADDIKGLSTDAYSALVADTREAHEFTPAMSYAVLRHSDQKAEIEYIGKLGRMANRFRIGSQEAGGKLNKMARPYVDMVRQEKNQQQVVESDTPSELPSAATTEPNLESARKLLQEQKDATGNKKAEANVKRKIRALAKKTPITDERTVLALDMAATRLGMDGLEFAEAAPAPVAAAAPEPKPVTVTRTEGVTTMVIDPSAGRQQTPAMKWVQSSTEERMATLRAAGFTDNSQNRVFASREFADLPGAVREKIEGKPEAVTEEATANDVANTDAAAPDDDIGAMFDDVFDEVIGEQEPEPEPESESESGVANNDPNVINGYSDKHPDWAQNHAKDVGGRVVYSDSEVALIEGFSVLTGAPVYSGAVGTSRTKVDIEGFKGSVFSEHQKQRLIDAKQRHVRDMDRKHQERPNGPFEGGETVAFSDGIPEEMRQVASGWLEMLGIKGRVFITTTPEARRDASAEKYGLYGPYAAIRSAGLDANEGGSTRKLSNGDHYIALKLQKRQSQTLETLAHEMGHILEKEAWSEADTNTKNAIIQDYNNWISTAKETKAEDWVKQLRAHTNGKLTTGQEGMMADRLPPYWRSFSEYFADQVSRWATTEEKPRGLVERFFARIGQAMSRLFGSEQGRKYWASDSMREWLNDRSRHVAMDAARAEPAEQPAPNVVEDRPSETRSAGEALGSAAKNTAKGLSDAIDGLGKLFGGGGRLSSGLTFDEDTYAKAKPLFLSAVSHLGAAGNDLRDAMKAVVQMVVDRFGADTAKNMKPYVVRFIEDVRDGKVDLEAKDDTDRNAAGDTEPLVDVPQGSNEEAGQGGDQAGAGVRKDDPGRDGRPEADRDGRADRVDGGEESVLPDGSTESREPSAGQLNPKEDKPSALSGENPGNFVITADSGVGEGTTGQKISANIAAIETLIKIRNENRYATKDEQAVLAKYVGWGGLKSVFDSKKTGATDMYGRAQAKLRELLTKDEYEAAFDSVRNAHYTAPGVVDAMWRLARHMGFNGGRALEPTVGVGNFLGLQPADLSASTEWHASELDAITGGIAKNLYPDANILDATGFQDAPFANGVFDLAIGNPPFGAVTIRDANKSRSHLNGMKVHNYIIAKTGMHLRPGGVMAMVVTHRFLDTANDEARSVLAKDFKFVGAIRLPNNAFMANAGTEVVTDIVILQKYRADEKRDANPAWLDVNGSVTVDGESIRVNKYFENNPENILGRSAMDGTMYGAGKEYTVHGDGRDIGEAIDGLMQTSLANIQGIMQATDQDRDAVAVMVQQSDMAVGSLRLTDDGRIERRELDDEAGNAVIEEITDQTLWGAEAEEWGRVTKLLTDLKAISESRNPTAEERDALIEATRFAYTQGGGKVSKATKAHHALYELMEDLDSEARFQWNHDGALELISNYFESKKLGEKNLGRLKGILDLRNRTLALIKAEIEDTKTIEFMRGSLNKAYDRFVKDYGFISDPANTKVLDGDIGAEAGLESSYTPAVSPAVAKSTGQPVRKASANKSDILKRRVNFPRKEITSAESPADALDISLSERGRVDLSYMANLLGMSANEVAVALSQGDSPRLFRNPETGAYEDAESYLSGNVKHKLEAARSAGMKQNIKALEAVQPKPLPKSRIKPNIRGLWMPESVFSDFLKALGVPNPNMLVIHEQGILKSNGAPGALTELGMQFKDDDVTVTDLFNAAAAGKSLTVWRKVGNDRVKDEAATKRVNALAERMGKVFVDFAYSDDMRANAIVDAFNERMNTHRERVYDGEKYLRTVGANPSIELRRTQKNGAWRMVQSKTMLADHVVGAGKTFTAIAGIMERRRLGLSRKPLVAVPNHLVVQWARDFYQMYPSAKVLAATPKDFEKKNRRRLLARIATGDYDAVIVGHTSIGFMENNADDSRAIIQESIDSLRAAMESAREAGESGRTLTQIRDRLEKYEGKLAELQERTVDHIGVDFKDLGIDYLVVDEAHEFKNLEYATAGERVVGMNDPKGSKRAFDLYTKVRGLLNRGGGVTFLTGTPVSNSLVEIYTMMKYLAHDELVLRNQEHFDAWSGAYAATETRMEYTATQKMKARRVLSGLNNLSALRQLYEQFADIITMDNLKRIYAEERAEKNAKNGTNLSTRFPVPKVKGGMRRLDVGPITPAQKEYMDYLVARMNKIEATKGPAAKEYSKIDNPLNVLTDARKVSLDIRVVDPTADRDENGKVMRAARSIKAHYDQWSSVRGTQMVFSDLSTPAKTAGKNAKALIKKAIEVIHGDGQAKRINATLAGMTYNEQWAQLKEQAEDLMESEGFDQSKAEAIEKFFAEDAADADGVMTTADTGFSVYDDLRTVLGEMGIPESEVAFIHEYDTPEQKEKLFDRMNNGYVRVLIGSTPKMGAGTNAQKRLVALHHLDAPWRPSDVEQREGRIIRQGNLFYQAIDMESTEGLPEDILKERNRLRKEFPNGFEVDIPAYSTSETSDTVMWQILERKAGAIEQFRVGGLDSVEENSSDSDQYAEFMATSTGNRVFKDKLEAEKKHIELEAEVSGLRISKSNAQSFVSNYPRRRESAKNAVEALKGKVVDAISFDGQGGAAAEYESVMEAERAAHIEKIAEWEKKKAVADAQIAAWEAAPEATRGKKPPTPTKPPQPNMTHKAVTSKSGYARAVIAALDSAKPGATKTLDLGNGLRVEITGKAFEGGVMYSTTLRGGWYDISLARVQVTNKASDSPNLVQSLEPAYIQNRIDDVIRRESNAIKELDASLPKQQKMAEMPLDETPVKQAQEAKEWFEMQVAFAEARADYERSLRPNRYIPADSRRFPGADLEEGGTVAAPEPQSIVVDGVEYETTGYKSFNRIEASRVSDSLPVVLFEHKEEGSDPTYTLVEQPEHLRKAEAVKFSFAGQKSGTAMHSELAKAKRMAARGVGNEDVRQATGWHRGADGKWRYEISDHDAKLAVSGKNMGEVIDMATMNALADNRKHATIGDVMDHPALFRAYPDLASIQVRKMDDPSRTAIASVRVTGKEFIISLNPIARGDYALSALLHELQHAIQTIEGFARGGNTRMAAKLANLSVPSKAAANAYMRLSGEVEARNTQARMRMDDEFRKLFPPSETQDVSDADAIVTFNGSEVQDFTAADPITKQELREVFTSRFPRLAKALDGMLAKGDKRESGGLVILDSADPLRIAGQFSKITGRNLNESIRLFSNAEDAQGFFDPRSGLTFLVGPSVNETNAAAVVLHEAIHGQQNKRLDQAAVKMLVNRKQEGDKDTRDFLERVVRHMARVEGGVVEHEAAAYIVEMAIKEGRDTGGHSAIDGKLMTWIENNLGKTIADLVRDFVKAYRQFALRHGLPLKVTIDDMIDYAQASMKQSAKEGASSTQGAAAFSRDAITNTPALKNWPASGNEPIILRHDSHSGDPITVTAGYQGKTRSNGAFDGIFAGPNGGMDGDKVHAVILDPDRILTHYAFRYDIPYSEYEKAIKDLHPSWNDEQVERAWDYVAEDKEPFSESEEDYADLFGSDAAEASWRAQGLRGAVARKLGFQAVEMSDETGIATQVLEGVTTIPLREGESFSQAESRLFDEWREWKSAGDVKESRGSATGNTGDFDPTNPDIRFSRSGAQGGAGQVAASKASGQQAQTETAAFKRWFGDSKVVDAEGKPLVVYHGTPQDEFYVFDHSKGGENTGAKDTAGAFYFAGRKKVAQQYLEEVDGLNDEDLASYKKLMADAEALSERLDTEYSGRPMDRMRDPRHNEVKALKNKAYALWDKNAKPIKFGHVKEVYLQIEDPLIVDFDGDAWDENRQHRIIREAKENGHDGVIFKNIQDGGWFGGVGLDDVYVAFEPEQIKSATDNSGDFDPTNPDIRFSRSGIKGMASAATAELNRTFSAPGKLSLWHKTIGTMYNLAERSPHFKPVFEAAQTFIDDVAHFATDAAELAPTLLPSLETWRDIAKKPITSKDNAAIAKPIFEGTLSWTRDDNGTPVRLEDGDDAQAGIVWTDDELRSMFDLNDKQVQLYHEFREATNRSLDTMARADMLRFGGKDLKAVQAEAMDAADVHDAARVIVRHLKELADENPDRKTELMQTAHGIAERAERVQELQDQGYAPLSRFGKYTVDVVVEGERQYFGLFETMREANKMKEAMAAEFGAGNVSQGTLSNETYKLFAGVTPETLELFGNMLGLDSDGDAAQDKAFQDYLRLTKTNRSAMRRLIHRKGIAGYSEDVGRVLASFVYSNSRQTAAGLNIGELGDAINAIPKEQGELKDAAVRLGEYIKNPQEEGQVIRGFLFAQYLGGSVASAFVNLTQPVQVTFPWLTQFTSATNAAAQLTKAVKQMSTRGLKYEADLAAALKAAEDDGTVSPQEIHQLMGQARGKGLLKAGDGTRAGEARAAMANATARLSLAWGKMFSSAEQANRRITFIAAYRIARDAKMADPAGFARRAVRETQFVYSKAAKMQWGRGAVGGTLMTFKTYSVSYIELMHRLWTQGEPGSVERAQGRKAAMVMIATLFLISGAGGLPFAEDAEDLIDGAAQLMGYNFSSKKVREDFIAEVFGDAIADFIDKGVSGLPGAPMDVSGRLGLGNLIPGTGLFQERTSHTRDVLEILGPGGDFVDRVVSGGRKVLGGNVTAGMLEMSPVAVRNLAKGTDMAVHGMYRDSKGYKVLDTNILEAAAKAAGFQPATVAKIQEANWINQRAKNYYSMRAQEIRQMWASGIFEKNQNKVQQARQAIADWNAKNPDQPMLIRIPDVMRRVREMAKTKDERIAATAPKAMRQQMREDLARVRETL